MKNQNLLSKNYLFSNNYLNHHLPETTLWSSQKEKATTIFKEIQEIYRSVKTLKLGPGEEAGLEDKFIRPVLKLLGFEWDVQPTTNRGTKKKRPDYALFKNKDSYETARVEKQNFKRFFGHAITILEAKYWGRRLNDTDLEDTIDHRDPTAQTVKYLDDVYYISNGRIQWAILTNGKQWRLFYYRASSRSGNFFEIDLEELITENNPEKFLYFYLFFSKDAFVSDTVTGKTWLDQHLEGSEVYAKTISERLKDLIFDKVFEGLAEGFIHYRRAELNIAEETEDRRREIFKGCLTLLYRLLFLLYAESRNLLPVQEDGYYRASLKKLKEDIYKDLSTTGLDKMSKRSYVYWARLEGIFKIIAEGDHTLNVPIYNGGLFENSPPLTIATLNNNGSPASLEKGGKGGFDSFISIHKMPDPFLAEAIKLLTIDQGGKYAANTIPFIDYSSLSVRHLGDIYEGLLEFHIQIADEDMVEVRESDKLIWKRVSELQAGTRTHRRKAKGEVYIENSKHERKATGSYYTPHYIVEYIVKNTVGQTLEYNLKTAAGLLVQLEKVVKASHRQQSTSSIKSHGAKILEIEDAIFNTLFNIKVLDPAMGSGHFLVHTVDFISDKIISFLADYPKNPVIKRIEELKKEIIGEIKRQGVTIDESKLTEVNLIKRMVMKRCIYGVDLNDMAVELAKLSLWLDSFTLGAPLSFLDHHLKCGNSLIGILDISDVVTTSSEAYLKLQRSLSFMLQVSELTDATVSETKKSYALFRNAQQSVEPIKRRFDVVTAKYFIDIDSSSARAIVEKLSYTPDLKNEPHQEILEKYKKTLLQIAQDKRFFHWKLEFPEVFYTERGEKENPGFDCVIGNPPYRTLSLGKGQESITENELKYLRSCFPESSQYKTNTFAMFFDNSLRLTRQSGKAGMILPLVILTNHFFVDFRKLLLTKQRIDNIVGIEQTVFEDVEIGGNSIFIVTRKDSTQSLDNEILFMEIDKDLKFRNKASITQNRLFNLPDSKMLSNKATIDLLLRLQEKNIPLSSITTFYNGIKTGDNERFLSDKPLSEKYRKVIRGRDIDRYFLEFGEIWVLFDPELLWSNTNSEMFEASPKIIIRQTGDRLISTVDMLRFYTMDTTHLIIPKNINPYYLLSLINSNLLNWCHRQIVPEEGKAFAEVKIVNLEYLPISSISFTTPEKERKKYFIEAVDLYDDSRYEDILKWADNELDLGRNDTIHDLLAYLAEQMIELNKAKNEEIKGFLKWLEREIGAGIEDLANKTVIKEYHKHSFEHLLDVLKKNRNIISIDPSDRKKQELLEKHFTKSIVVLEPLKDKITNTDNLIDQIVYKLYGLTDEEIRIVEGRR